MDEGEGTMPEEYQPSNRSGNQSPALSRRRLITSLLGFSIVATLGGVLTPILGYLWPPKRALSGKGDRVQVGIVAEFPVGQGKVVPVNDKPVIVVNTEQGAKAFSAICTHLACIVEWDANRQIILCPCHDGRFSPFNGGVISGPPPAPLPELPLTVEGDAIYVSEV
jgi:cytochrome b6-f complex iron-sulfur subunit